jgi:tRNA pseudouridine38-40 synthase
LTLSYDGTAYAGWQIQNRARTIQGELEAALERIAGERIKAVASGRTDAGVHAWGQTVSFSSRTRLEPEILRRAINAHLPRDIVVLDVREAPAGFHAISDAIQKRYRYVIQDGPVCDVFQRAYAWFVPQRLDVVAMQQAGQSLVGRHDFSSFEAAGSNRLSSVRTVSDVAVRRRKTDHLDQVVIEVQADGFLYNMVRNMVGSLVAVGRQRQSVDWIAEVLAARDRTRAGMTAPPQGLTLLWVDYGW